MSKRSQVTRIRKDEPEAPPPAPKEEVKLPDTFKAFTTFKVPGGWSFVELTVDKDMNVVDLKASQPDVRAIIQEKFRLTVGRYWQKEA